MKILIVNGYAKTEKGKEEFNRFQQIIQEIFRTQTDFVDTNFEFVIRGRDDLDDFIYELDSAYMKKNSAKNFDHVDMVFVQGEPNLLPWSPQISKIMILLRMCMRSKKVLFASSFAMQALVFLAATNTEKNIQIINNKGKGGRITDIMQYNDKVNNLKHDDYFLDNTTGDLYCYNYETSEWIPKMNIGLHYTQAAQAHNSLGKYVVNTPSYKPRVFDDKQAAFLSKPDEDFCYTKKIYLQHWAIAELPSEFVIPAKNSWDIHKFNFVNGSKTFYVLAESRKTPQIIIFEPYCVGTLFNISKKYPLTVSILKNFILSKLKELKGMPTKHRGLGIEKTSEEFRATTNSFFNFITDPENLNQTGRRTGRGPSTNLKSITSVDRASTANSTASRPKTAKLVHSGYALAHHDEANLIVENNTVRSDFTIKLTRDKPSSMKNLGDTQTLNKKISVNDIETNFDSTKFVPSTLRSKFPATTSSDGFAFQNYFRNTATNQETKTTGFKRSPTDSFNGYNARNKSNFQIDTDPDMQNIQKNKAEIARMLYPDLPRDAVKEEELWIPGQLSKTRPQTATSKNAVKITMATSFGSRFYSSYNRFKESNPDEARAKPLIRTSGEYMTEDEKRRQEEKENAKRFLGPAHLTAGTKVKPIVIPNYVSLTFSKPPINHKFREVDKTKWVGGLMKLC